DATAYGVYSRSIALTESKTATWTIASARPAGGVRKPPGTAAWVASVVWFQSVTTSDLAANENNTAVRPADNAVQNVLIFNFVELMFMVFIDLFSFCFLK